MVGWSKFKLRLPFRNNSKVRHDLFTIVYFIHYFTYHVQDVSIIDATWTPGRLKLPAMRQSIQQLVHANNMQRKRKSSILLVTLWWQSTGGLWIPLTKGPVIRIGFPYYVFFLMNSMNVLPFSRFRLELDPNFKMEKAVGIVTRPKNGLKMRILQRWRYAVYPMK